MDWLWGWLFYVRLFLIRGFSCEGRDKFKDHERFGEFKFVWRLGFEYFNGVLVFSVGYIRPELTITVSFCCVVLNRVPLEMRNLAEPYKPRIRIPYFQLELKFLTTVHLYWLVYFYFIFFMIVSKMDRTCSISVYIHRSVNFDRRARVLWNSPTRYFNSGNEG